jgi:hypothetical protein
MVEGKATLDQVLEVVAGVDDEAVILGSAEIQTSWHSVLTRKKHFQNVCHTSGSPNERRT